MEKAFAAIFTQRTIGVFKKTDWCMKTTGSAEESLLFLFRSSRNRRTIPDDHNRNWKFIGLRVNSLTCHVTSRPPAFSQSAPALVESSSVCVGPASTPPPRFFLSFSFFSLLPCFLCPLCPFALLNLFSSLWPLCLNHHSGCRSFSLCLFPEEEHS